MMTMNAVDVAGVSFKYQKANVLQNISFSVPNQKIHALLGPSGSGKTTLLRLMLGRIRPSSGMITVFGSNKPGHFNRQIGYMPQSQALSPELSISETMNYFASLYQLTKRHFEEQKAILTEVFRLPPDDQQIVGTLSGGQQKALSLALVFLHSPRLAILDEPTVGTDPLLGDQIWSFLHRQVDHHGLTVIIVTHYILEASLAHHVAMMRNGRLIEEGTPQSLYLKYAETNLETIFIKICTDKTLTAESSVQKRAQTYQQNIVNFLAYDDKPPSSQTPQKVDSLVTAENHQQQKMMGLEIAETSFSNSKVSKDPYPYQQQQQQPPQLHQYTSNSYSLLWILFILVRRNLQKFLNSKLTTIMLFSPIFCTLLMCITFKVDKIMLPTAVFNEDLKGSALQRYSEEMQRLSKSFQVHHIKYQQYHSLEDAVQAVERGQAVAALWFEKEFSEALTKRALASIVKKKEEEEEDESGDEGDGGDEDVLEEGGDGGDGVDESLNELAKSSLIRTMSTTTTTSATTTTSEDDNSTTMEITISPTTTTTPEDLFLETTTTTQTFITTPKTIIRKSNSTTRSPKRAQRSKRRNKHKDYDFDDEDEEEGEEEEEEGEGELHRQGNFIPLSNRTLARSSMKLYLDNSNMFYAQPLADMLRFASWELLNQVVSDHGELTVAQPVVVQEVVYAAGTETPDFLLSGYMIAFLYLSQVTLSSQLLIEERKDGFFDRTIVAGARHWLLFASHFVTNFLFSFGQIGAMFLVGFAWYGIPNFGSYWLCFLLALLQSASSIMTGLLISAVCRENFSAFFIALSITLSQLFTSGAVFPIISFDPLISTILSLTPISMPVESLRNVMLRGWTLAHLRVAHGCLTNVVTTLGFGLVALYFFIRRS